MAQAALKKSESTSDKSSRAFPRALSDRRTRLIAAPFIGLILALPWLHQALWPLEWLGLAAALWVVAESDSPIEATLTTFLIGFSGILMAFYWLVATINLFGNYSEVPSALLFGVLAIYMGLQWAAFGGIAKWLGPGPMLLTAPIVWVAIEFLFPTVFPYRMGAINADVIALAQIADITGVFALSFLMVWMGAAAVAVIRERYFQALYAPIAATLFILVYGVVRLLTFSADQPPISVALLQGNISVGQKFDRANFQKNIQQYRSKSLSLGDRADLIVWPETVVQFALDGRLKQLP